MRTPSEAAILDAFASSISSFEYCPRAPTGHRDVGGAALDRRLLFSFEQDLRPPALGFHDGWLRWYGETGWKDIHQKVDQGVESLVPGS
jgi:hypothetical protein